jgi:hypothetical protein
MSRLLSYVAGIAAAAVLAAGAAVAQARPVPPSHVVYGCQSGTIWLTPGHHPIGFVGRGSTFEVIRYSASGRWALGIAHFPRTRFTQRGWVRVAHLCRTRPA